MSKEKEYKTLTDFLLDNNRVQVNELDKDLAFIRSPWNGKNNMDGFAYRLDKYLIGDGDSNNFEAIGLHVEKVDPKNPTSITSRVKYVALDYENYSEGTRWENSKREEMLNDIIKEIMQPSNKQPFITVFGSTANREAFGFGSNTVDINDDNHNRIATIILLDSIPRDTVVYGDFTKDNVELKEFVPISQFNTTYSDDSYIIAWLGGLSIKDPNKITVKKLNSKVREMF